MKYGKENFTLQILYYGEDYNNKEKYYIKLYDARNKEKGYNILEGGEGYTPDDVGKINSEIAEKIKKRIIHNKGENLTEIAKDFNVSLDIVVHINVGESWYDNNLEYPLRRNRIKDVFIHEIISDLKYTNLSQKELSEKFNVGISTIRQINYGNTYKQENETYPLRSNALSKEMIREIEKYLICSNMNYNQISSIYEVCKASIIRANSGALKNSNKTFIFPLRKNKVKNYKILKEEGISLDEEMSENE